MLFAFSRIALRLRNMDLPYAEILTGENRFLKAAAVRAIALMLYDVEYLVTLVALGKTGDDIHDELHAVKYRPLRCDGVDLLDVLGDDERQLADVKHDLLDPVDTVFLRKVLHCADDLLYDSDFFLK